MWQSSRFCAPDADITILSSDRMVFKLHRKHLSVHSSIFADAENTTLPDAEAIDLSEKGDALELLFQFMYPMRQPNLSLVPFATFYGLAEAAEKYEVFSAKSLCHLRMKEYIVGHPLEVLNYAVKHQYPDLEDEAARRSMAYSIEDGMKLLNADAFILWCRFRVRWKQATTSMISALVVSNSRLPSMGETVFRGNYQYPELTLARKCLVDPNPSFSFRQELHNNVLTSRLLNAVMCTKFRSDNLK